MDTAITIIQVASLLIIIAAVLLQQKGTGLSDVFGGGSSFYQTKRGAEKFLFWATIVAAITFLVTSGWQIFAN
jgi:protein translocase SecG subunit